MNIIVTGGLGFIGSTLIKSLLKNKKFNIFNIDKISKVSVKESLFNLSKSELKRYHFLKENIQNYNKIKIIINKIKPDAIFNLAAESHVDNSIINPSHFIHTNVLGTYNLLDISKNYFYHYKKEKKKFRFIHVSTDEVYGSLSKNSKPFIETDKYFPNSPYSASKASSDHLVHAWYKTYNLPCIITNCSNNYGPWQFPEKLIPVVIAKAILNKNIPIYGDGQNIRDWIHVNDHVDSLIQIFNKGKIGENYNIGSNNEISNIKLVELICAYLNKTIPKKKNYLSLIKFVSDRPGHDFRYSINANKIKNSLNIKPKYNFKKGIESTVDWYVNNSIWLIKNYKKVFNEK